MILTLFEPYSLYQPCRMVVKSEDGRELRSFRFKDEDDRYGS